MTTLSDPTALAAWPTFKNCAIAIRNATANAVFETHLRLFPTYENYRYTNRHCNIFTASALRHVRP